MPDLASGEPMRHTISIILQNEAGALTRVAGLFSSRGYNIESLHVAPTHDHRISRLTLVTTGSDDVIHQICNQLLKLVDVVDLLDMTTGDHLERELLLVKLRVQTGRYEDLARLVAETGGRTLDTRADAYTVELTAYGPDIDAFLEAVEPYGEIITVVRSGVVAISRGPASLEHELGDLEVPVSH